jgi:serine/threonine protein kinase
VLTPFYPLHANFHETEIFSQVARALAATKAAVETLKSYYYEMKSSPKASSSSNNIEEMSFPYRTYYKGRDPQGQRVEFRYEKRIEDTKLMFLAKNTQGRTVFIKFTRKYSATAHEYCSDRGVAPILHAVERLPGGWFMVVMDYLDSTLYSHPLAPIPPDDRSALYSRIKRAMDILHDGGFVHGDFRDINMMIRNKAQFTTLDEDPGVMLLDFDWAGKNGDIRYPPNVNTELWRPPGVADGVMIEQAHDQAMLNHMFEDENQHMITS